MNGRASKRKGTTNERDAVNKAKSNWIAKVETRDFKALRKTA